MASDDTPLLCPNCCGFWPETCYMCSPAVATAVLPIPEREKKVETNPERCGQCNKKLGLTRVFTCRCGGTYCPSHRYPEEHDCNFDFRGSARQSIAKANPAVKPDKLERI